MLASLLHALGKLPLVLSAVLLAGGSLLAQDPHREIIQQYEKTRREDAGPLRLDSVEKLAALRLPENVERFIDALVRNDTETRVLERRLEVDNQKAYRLQKLLGREGDPARKQERLQKQYEQAVGDGHYHRLRLAAVQKENRALRKGILEAFNRLDAESGTAAVERMKSALGSAESYTLRRELILLCGEARRQELLEPLADAIDDRDPRTRADAALALGNTRLPDAEAALLRALEDPYETVRLEVIRSLPHVGGEEAVDALITRVDQEKGRLQEEVVLALRRLCGVSFADNRALWEDWWARSRENYRRPDRPGGRIVRGGLRARDRARNKGLERDFYGVAPASHALVFLVDKSGSMNEPASAEGTTGSVDRNETKMDRAKRELVRVVDGLPPGTSVNIVAYGDRVEPYATSMVTLTDLQRRAMKAWVKSLRAEGQTNMFDALELVLNEARGKKQRITRKMAIDTIFLLTDGIPTAGKLTDADLIAEEVARLNASSRIVIHTVGIGRDHARTLLKRLSEDSQGLYIAAR